jgi:hypothetical protein
MATVSSNIAINQPVDKVFAFVTAAESQKNWQAGILDAKVTPDGPVTLGSTYHYTTEVMCRRVETQLQVSTFEQSRKWGVKTIGVPRPVETVYLFDGDGKSTQLTISMELNGGYPAAAEAMVKQQMQKSLDDQGHRIKQMIEK